MGRLSKAITMKAKLETHIPECGLEQGSPAPGPWTSTGPQPVKNWAAQQEVSGG